MKKVYVIVSNEEDSIDEIFVEIEDENGKPVKVRRSKLNPPMKNDLFENYYRIGPLYFADVPEVKN